MKSFEFNCKTKSPDGKVTATNVQFEDENLHVNLSRVIGYFEDFLISCGYNVYPGSLQLTNNKPYKDINAK